LITHKLKAIDLKNEKIECENQQSNTQKTLDEIVDYTNVHDPIDINARFSLECKVKIPTSSYNSPLFGYLNLKGFNN
jgi:hypothetical protein